MLFFSRACLHTQLFISDYCGYVRILWMLLLFSRTILFFLRCASVRRREQAIKDLLSPEDLCLFESMRIYELRLEALGLSVRSQKRDNQSLKKKLGWLAERLETANRKSCLAAQYGAQNSRQHSNCRPICKNTFVC